MKKIFRTFILMITVVISCVNAVYATNTEFKIIENEGQTKQLDNDQGYISKHIVDSNVENGEVIIEIKLSNTSKEEQKVGKTEVVFVVDNSASMGTLTSSKISRKNTIINATENFVNNLYKQNSNVYMGLVKFSEKANVITNLTNQKQTILNGINTFEKTALESDTNIAIGLTTANSKFSSDCKNKIIVLLTDGISYPEETKAALKNVAKSGTYIISMISETNSNKVVEAFGTEVNPTAGKLYNIGDTDINKIITDSIFEDIIETIQKPITNITIADYFPEDIINNFEFSYVQEPNYGKISQTIDKNGSIVWKIDSLMGSEEATVKYKLKLKDMNNQSIINKIIPTNEKVDITYTDYNNKKYEVVLDKSPKVQLYQELIIEGTEQEATKEEETLKIEDNTTVKTIIPKTGTKQQITMLLIILLLGFCVSVKLKEKREIKKVLENKDI